MHIGYSLLIDEYVNANQVEPDDCELLRIACPVCMKPVELARNHGKAALSHQFPKGGKTNPLCENSVSEFSSEYMDAQNALARAQRIEFFHWELFKELLNQDPVTKYDTHAVMELGKLKSLGALQWFPDWHREMVVDVYKDRLTDKVEFWSDGEAHLEQFGNSLAHIPSSGYGRHVHFQIAYDLMQHVLSGKGLANDNYSWLFAHAFRLCAQKWTGEAKIDKDDEEHPTDEDPAVRKRIYAARTIIACCCDLMMDDKEKHPKAIETLNEETIKLAWTPIAIPLLSFMGYEILSVMKTTLFRLPYLPMLRSFERPCRPHVA